MRLTLIDTLTTVVFFTLLAGLTELYIAGMAPFEVLKTRLLMIPMMLVTGRPYGLWRDYVFAIAKPSGPWRKSLVDGAAFLSFQLPVYALILWIAGAQPGEILTLLATTSVLMFLVSRPFGLVLDAARRLAGAKAG
ncbi:MAG: L-alanine exporter AlaE [Sulfitobacter sp.]